MTRIGWGMGKREVLLLKTELISLFKEGATTEEAYRRLKDRLTVGRSTFHRYAGAIKQEVQPHLSTPRKPSPKPLPEKSDPPTIGRSFNYEPSSDDKKHW